MEMGKSWGEMGERVGLEVVNDEEVEWEEEDREVEQIIRKGKEMKRKLATGIWIVFDVRQVKQCTVQYMCKIIVLILMHVEHVGQ